MGANVAQHLSTRRPPYGSFGPSQAFSRKKQDALIAGKGTDLLCAFGNPDADADTSALCLIAQPRAAPASASRTAATSSTCP